MTNKLIDSVYGKPNPKNNNIRAYKNATFLFFEIQFGSLNLYRNAIVDSKKERGIEKKMKCAKKDTQYHT